MIQKKTENVPVGEYRITAEADRELFTVVGSCVALVLYDAGQHMAGMLHAVLPGDRTQYRKGDRHTWYADTGLYLLMQDMICHGAEKKNLQAVLAGGASLLSAGNSLDIGARNTENLTVHLGRNRIPIIRSETGGNSARRVRVSAADGNVTVTSLTPAMTGQENTGADQSFDLHEMKTVLRQIMNLKPHPAVAGNLLEAVHHPPDRIDWEKIRDLISRDLPFALHFFRLANSPHFGNPGKISSFETALRCFGPVSFRRICALTALGGWTEHAADYRKISASGLSLHCLTSAIIALYLAGNREPGFREKAFTAAILHGTGGLPGLLQKQKTSRSGEDIPVPGKIGYGRLGGMILSGFGIPENICAAVISHEFPELCRLGDLPLSAYVHMGCAISRMLGFTSSAEAPAFVLSPEVIKKLSPDGGLSALIPGILWEITEKGLSVCFGSEYAENLSLPGNRFFLASQTNSV